MTNEGQFITPCEKCEKTAFMIADSRVCPSAGSLQYNIRAVTKPVYVPRLVAILPSVYNLGHKILRPTGKAPPTNAFPSLDVIGVVPLRSRRRQHELPCMLGAQRLLFGHVTEAVARNKIFETEMRLDDVRTGARWSWYWTEHRSRAHWRQ